ncbi:MAG: biliverdin-producing heme oxygenase [Rhodospirillaceae bacterium]|nr:biliverdin-producing heme oxygenase [Rhodospirillaceae bacterium]
MSAQQTAQFDNAKPKAVSGLADRLRERTRALHSRAERSGIVRDLLTGQANRHGYAVYLRNILPAYREIEAGLERNRAAPGLDLIVRPDVYRTPALESDLRTLHGDSFERALPLLPEGERYRRRIAKVASAAPTRLIAYAYVRYLGDLNGGLILRKLLARSLGLDSLALAFYDFPLIDDLAAMKRSYRSAFDLAGLEIGDPSSIVSEAVMAFQLNNAVSQAVHDLLTGAVFESS